MIYEYLEKMEKQFLFDILATSRENGTSVEDVIYSAVRELRDALNTHDRMYLCSKYGISTTINDFDLFDMDPACPRPLSEKMPLGEFRLLCAANKIDVSELSGELYKTAERQATDDYARNRSESGPQAA